MGLNMFYNKYCYKENASGNDSAPGKCHLFSFDKSVQTGTGTSVVTLGYENIQYHALKLKERKRPAYVTHSVAL